MNSISSQCAISARMAFLHVDALCIRKAYEYIESAVVLANLEKQDIALKFKYRLAHCKTKRRLSDFNEAKKDLDALIKEIEDTLNSLD